ncbi:hypothetical protein KIL84_018759 [Mauremys mutica]|uniref:Uncharacterized protein n=1 Tax=Mauremys mutica TaxID=74926 RepID=A0A9D3XVL5_9SAUR|nr:hypothetical protein KIL84_018759 [Mauremys mutica]
MPHGRLCCPDSDPVHPAYKWPQTLPEGKPLPKQMIGHSFSSRIQDSRNTYLKLHQLAESEDWSVPEEAVTATLEPKKSSFARASQADNPHHSDKRKGIKKDSENTNSSNLVIDPGTDRPGACAPNSEIQHTEARPDGAEVQL